MADEAVATVQRIATELRPAVLGSLGICAALEWLARDFREHNEIRCRAFVPEEDDPRIDQDVATAAFRIVQESLANAARHSRATEVEIHLLVEAERLAVMGVPVDQDGSCQQGSRRDQGIDQRQPGIEFIIALY